ncbi:MAG: orotidine-5'-phosphate decarboxylase [Phycisphaerales bacterium]
MSEHFADRLAAAVERAGSPVCVGLDPVLEKLPGELRSDAGASKSAADFDGTGRGTRAIGRFCEGVIDAVAGVVPAVKLQSACFERYGGSGVDLLRALVQRVRAAGMVAILDAKRGDIGISAEHYAAAAFGPDGASGADAVTLSGYMGPDTMEPFLTDPSRGVFVLVRTSNPGSDVIQSQRLADGRTVAELVADQVAVLGQSRVGACGLSSVGAVVGATKPEDGPMLRARMPDQVFLVPGYGAQGGSAADIRGMLRMAASSGSTTGERAARAGVLVTASRSIIYPTGGEADWRGAIGAAARRMAAEIGAIVG